MTSFTKPEVHSTSQRQSQVTYPRNLVKIERAVSEICSRTDTQTPMDTVITILLSTCYSRPAAKGRIPAAPYRMVLKISTAGISWYAQAWSQGAPSREEIRFSVPCMVPWAHLSSHHIRHLDRFSRFAGLTIVVNRQTDWQSTLQLQ